MGEVVWKPVAGYEGRYEVSDTGLVRSLQFKGKPRSPPRVLAAHPTDQGYRTVALSEDGSNKTSYVHRLVLEAFVGPCPSGQEACHNNGVKVDNNLANLRWDTKRANQGDRVRHGTACKGVRHPLAKLSEDDVREIREFLALGARPPDIAKLYGVTATPIKSIKYNKAWKTVND